MNFWKTSLSHSCQTAIIPHIQRFSLNPEVLSTHSSQKKFKTVSVSIAPRKRSLRQIVQCALSSSLENAILPNTHSSHRPGLQQNNKTLSWVIQRSSEENRYRGIFPVCPQRTKDGEFFLTLSSPGQFKASCYCSPMWSNRWVCLTQK